MARLSEATVLAIDWVEVVGGVAGIWVKIEYEGKFVLWLMLRTCLAEMKKRAMMMMGTSWVCIDLGYVVKGVPETSEEQKENIPFEEGSTGPYPHFLYPSLPLTQSISRTDE